MSEATRERLLELLADRATEGLSAIEEAELERLLAEHPDVDDLDFDLAAASIDLALVAETDAPLPAALLQQIERDAGPILEGLRKVRPLRPAAPVRPRRWMAPAGWLAAAGLAGLLLARMFMESAPDPLALRNELLTAGRDAITLEWSATGDEAGPEASGDVVWSNTRQTGVMRFRGLARNDPDEFQYQLWIFDSTRDDRYPIDGGVFDVDSESGDVLVPIDPKLTVRQPALFAVTVERPGGVVVSSRERIAVLAQIES